MMRVICGLDAGVLVEGAVMSSSQNKHMSKPCRKTEDPII